MTKRPRQRFPATGASAFFQAVEAGALSRDGEAVRHLPVSVLKLEIIDAIGSLRQDNLLLKFDTVHRDLPGVDYLTEQALQFQPHILTADNLRQLALYGDGSAAGVGENADAGE